jgi:hypothetical protein
VDIGLFASFVGISPYVSEREHPLQSLELVIGVLALYFAIVHWKGEPKNKNWDD